MHRDSLSNDSWSILSFVFNQMCDDAEFALETHVFCLLPVRVSGLMYLRLKMMQN